MDEHHEHMPGMNEHPTKPAPGKPEEKKKSEQSDESAHPDKAQHQPKPAKS